MQKKKNLPSPVMRRCTIWQKFTDVSKNVLPISTVTINYSALNKRTERLSETSVDFYQTTGATFHRREAQ